MSEPAKGSDRHLDLVSLGCRWRLGTACLTDDEAAALAARWQRAEGLAGAGTPVLDDDPEVIEVSPGHDPYDLSREVTRKGLTRLRGRASLLHAAALADDAGRTLVLVAGSGVGKSTATRVLGRDLGYVSDETVVLLADGRIAPHPKPPSLVLDPASPFVKEEPSPDELGLGPTPAQPRIAALLTLARDPEATEPVIEPVGLIDQILEILPQTSSTWWLPDGLDRLARAATAGGPPARLRYAEIGDCRTLVADHLATARPVEPSWEHLPPPARAEHPPTETSPGGGPDRPQEATSPREMSPGPDDTPVDHARLVRAPWSDAVAVDGEVLVLVGALPLRLAGPGAAAWRAAAEPRALPELTDAVVAELGEHPRAGERVEEAVLDLLEHGALCRA